MQKEPRSDELTYKKLLNIQEERNTENRESTDL